LGDIHPARRSEGDLLGGNRGAGGQVDMSNVDKAADFGPLCIFHPVGGLDP